MQDKQITFSVACFARGVSWVAMIGLIVAGGVTNVLEFYISGLAMSAVAATLSIRGYCVNLGESMQAAFDMGRDLGRGEVTQMRR